MECEICLKYWNNDDIIPKILPCGHTFCLSCLEKELDKSLKNKCIFKCPSCSLEFESIIEYKDILNLQINNSLISLAKILDNKKIEINTSNCSVSCPIRNNVSYLKNKTYDNSNQESKIKKKHIYSNNTFFPICPIHKKRAHFHIVKDNNFIDICNDCLQLEKYEDLNPLENLKVENKYKIDSCKNRTKILKEEINRIECFLKSYRKNFEIENNKKIKELFDYIKKIVSYNITTAKTLFNQCKKEQKIQIDKKMEELNSLRKELNMFEQKLDELCEINKKEQLPESQIELDNVYNKLSNYINYGNQLYLFTMKISIKDDEKGSLFDLIQNIYKLDIDFLKMKNGEIPTIKDLLNKTISWPCKCGNMNNKIGTIICDSCSKYRPLETYNNILFNPMLITNEEKKEYHIRRKHELKAFQSLNKKTINNNNFYFAIDSSWFNNWKCFVSNDFSEKIITNNEKYISENKSIGILPPGMIDNTRICDVVNDDKVKYKLKKGLKIKKDYILVNQLLWEWFLLNYEGGPDIIIENIENPSLLLNMQEINLPNNNNEYNNAFYSEKDKKQQ